jgi:hypothetical protein
LSVGFSTALQRDRSLSLQFFAAPLRQALSKHARQEVAGATCGRVPTIGETRIIRDIDAGISSERYPMSVLREERQLNTNQRRALELLAAAGEQNCTGARLANHGFTVSMLADLVWGGLATEYRETVRVGYRNIKVARIRITDAGRLALEG